MDFIIKDRVKYYTGCYTHNPIRIFSRDKNIHISKVKFNQSLTVYGSILNKLIIRDTNVKTYFRIGIDKSGSSYEESSSDDEDESEIINEVKLISVTIEKGIVIEYYIFQLLFKNCAVDGNTNLKDYVNVCTIKKSIFNGNFTCTCSNIKIIKCKINGNLNINIYDLDREFKNSIYIFDCEIDGELTINGDCNNLEIRESKIKSLILNSRIGKIKVKITNCDKCKFPKKQDCQKDTLENKILLITQN